MRGSISTKPASSWNAGARYSAKVQLRPTAPETTQRNIHGTTAMSFTIDKHYRPVAANATSPSARIVKTDNGKGIVAQEKPFKARVVRWIKTNINPNRSKRLKELAARKKKDRDDFRETVRNKYGDAIAAKALREHPLSQRRSLRVKEVAAVIACADQIERNVDYARLYTKDKSTLKAALQLDRDVTDDEFAVIRGWVDLDIAAAGAHCDPVQCLNTAKNTAMNVLAGQVRLTPIPDTVQKRHLGTLIAGSDMDRKNVVFFRSRYTSHNFSIDGQFYRDIGSQPLRLNGKVFAQPAVVNGTPTATFANGDIVEHQGLDVDRSVKRVANGLANAVGDNHACVVSNVLQQGGFALLIQMIKDEQLTPLSVDGRPWTPDFFNGGDGTIDVLRIDDGEFRITYGTKLHVTDDMRRDHPMFGGGRTPLASGSQATMEFSFTLKHDGGDQYEPQNYSIVEVSEMKTRFALRRSEKAPAHTAG